MSEFVPNLQGEYSYAGYRMAFEYWVANSLTSTPHAPPAYVEFTRLNLGRTQRIHKTVQLNAELINQVKELKHTYTWNVITEAWCGDSAQCLPVIAEAAGLAPERVRLVILLRDQHPELMEKYLTNGSRSIPKWIAVDETINKEIFVWGPRPAPAQELLLQWKANPNGKDWAAFERELHTWYARDKTATLQREMTSLLMQTSV